MPRSRLYIVLCCLLACTSLAALATFQYQANAAPTLLQVRATPYVAPAEVTPSPFEPVTPPEGLPAITPHGEAVGPFGAAFTEADVRRYVALADAGSLNRRVIVASAPMITAVEFITERELKSRTDGEGTGLPNDALVCYVELQGDFTLVSPFGSKPVALHKAMQVFDAHTGNLLMSGAGEK